MKSTWHVKKLDEVCDVEYGTRVVSKRDGGSQYPVYGGGGATFFMDEYNREDQMVIARFAMSALCTRFVKGKFFLNDSGLTIAPKDSKEIVQAFLDYQTIYLNDTFYALAKGSAQKNLDVPAFRKLDISYPESLEEQKRIVQKLDEVFAGLAEVREKAERNLRNARELFESYLQGVFENPREDWEYKTFKEISLEFGRGKSKHRPRNDKKLYGGKYPFIQTGDIRNSDHFITQYSQSYNETGLAQSKLWPKGTICITIAANIAETGILDFDSCFPDSVIGLVVDPKWSDENFVEYLLQFFKTKIQAKSKGSAQANINMATFENERFPFPNVKKQKELVKKLDALGAQTKELEAIFRMKIADVDELKKSVLQKAFSGEL